MSSTTIQIGTRLWKLDENHREYDENRKLIYEKCFRECYVVGENRASWFVNWDKDAKADDWRNGKVAKDTLLSRNNRGYSASKYYTNEGKQDHLWLKIHRGRITEKVRTETDVDTLARIGMLVNYDPSIQ